MIDDISVFETFLENNERAGELMRELSRLCPNYVFVRRDKAAALMSAARALGKSRLLLNIAFGEYACYAKYLPAEERAQFEKNYAVGARELIDTIAENDAALRASGIREEGKKG